VKRSILAYAALVPVLAISAPASAAVIASTSFESPTFPALGAGQDKYGPDQSGYNQPPSGGLVVPGFTFNGYSGIFSNPSLCCVLSTPYGKQFGFLQTFNDSGSSIAWTVNGLTLGDQYTLSFYDVGSGANGVGVDPLTVTFIGATALVSNDFTPSTTGWLSNSMSFTANAASAVITFNGSPTGGNLISGIDNVLVTTVPEPATWAMMLLGLFGLGTVLRSSQRKQGRALAAI
jgi:hypothetical protein